MCVDNITSNYNKYFISVYGNTYDNTYAIHF